MTCRKCKNSKCCFKWRFFADKTIIAIPLQHTLNQVDKFGILSKRNNILGQVKRYIDNNLDPNSKSEVSESLKQAAKDIKNQ